MREDIVTPKQSVIEETSNSLIFNKGSFDRVFQLINEGYQNWSSNRKIGTARFSEKSGQIKSVVQKEPLSTKASIADLPISVLLEIFSYLDVVALCRAACVCQSWNDISNDGLLWERKLAVESNRWEMIDHTSHPSCHMELDPDLSFKEIYLRCCPECRIKQNHTRTVKLIPNLGFYFGFSIPRVVMFGSGLDSNGFVQSLLWDDKSPFSVKKMFPGEFEGLGSGFTLQHSGGLLNLITLYRMSKAERENSEANHYAHVSKLLVLDPEDQQVSLSHPARGLCSTADAFVYVVKANDINKVCFGKEEFTAMLDMRWSRPKVPLLVLCLSENSTVSAVPSLQVADKLDLPSLTRPWQVRQCHIDTMYGLLPGVNWFTKRIMSA